MKETVKQLRCALHKAYGSGSLRSVRRISVLLMVAERRSVKEIVTAWNVSRQTIFNWVKALLYEGFGSLAYKKPQGRPAKLTKRQKKKLSQWIKAGPEANGYETGCWTSVLIQDLIYRHFDVLYNRFYVCELLHNLNFSRQKARFVSGHLDEEARKRWMAQEWPKILAEAKACGAPIFFGDEASFALWGSLSYTWAPCAEQPEIKTSGKRKGYKVFGLIEFFSGRLFYQGIDSKFNGESYIAFIKDVLTKVSGTIFIIQDGARYHTSKAVREFFEQQHEVLKVFQLPSYSPDYNPIEYLWKKVKTAATHNRYFDEFAKLVTSVEHAMAVLATQSDEIIRLMGIYTNHLLTTEPV